MKPESIKLGQIIEVGSVMITVLLEHLSNDRYSKATILIPYLLLVSTHFDLGHIILSSFSGHFLLYLFVHANMYFKPFLGTDFVVFDVVVIVVEDVAFVVDFEDDGIDDNVEDSIIISTISISVPAGRGVGEANLMFGEWFTLMYITNQQRAASATHCFCRFVRLL